jgi:predicted MFS family arabinose efflux permease
MVPYQIGALMDGRGLSAGTAGLLGTAELTAMSLSSILIVSLAGKIALRSIAIIGTILAITGQILTATVEPFWALGSVRILAGIGSGMVLAAASTAVALGANPNRVMGLGLTVANLLFLAAFFVTPQIVLRFGFRGLFVSLACYVAASSVSISRLHGSRPSQRPFGEIPVQSAFNRPRVAMLLVGLLSLNIGLGAIWSFAERIGRGIGLDSAHIGSVFAACPLAMIAGSATAGLLGNKFGNRWPLSIAAFTCGVACYGTALSTSLAGYTVGLLAFNFCYLMLGPFALAGVPSDLDPSGRLAAVANGTMWLAYSVGVAAGGLIAESTSVSTIGVFALCGCITAAAAFAYAAGSGAPIATNRT